MDNPWVFKKSERVVNMAVTIKDIARKAGVSYSTVSRALNDVGLVKEEKKARIVELARQMGYSPNLAAKNLQSSKAGTIGVYFSVIGKNTNPFVLHQVLTGVFHIVQKDYNIQIKGIDLLQKKALKDRNIDGALILSQRVEDDQFMEEALQKKIPAVVLNRPVFLGISNVLTDEAQGMNLAMNYLLDRGHTQIGIIEASHELPSVRARHRGWVEAVRERGIDPRDFSVIEGNYRIKSGYYAAKELLKQPLTAILCFNDEMAMGARDAIIEAGLRVPEDISLIGYDNIDLTTVTKAGLTTVERSMERIAIKGTEILLQMIKEKKQFTDRVYLESPLIVRSSVKDLRNLQE